MNVGLKICLSFVNTSSTVNNYLCELILMNGLMNGRLHNDLTQQSAMPLLLTGDKYQSQFENTHFSAFIHQIANVSY